MGATAGGRRVGGARGHCGDLLSFFRRADALAAAAAVDADCTRLV